MLCRCIPQALEARMAFEVADRRSRAMRDAVTRDG